MDRKSKYKIEDYIGKQFGLLIVIGEGKPDKSRSKTALCECQCKNKTIKEVRYSYLDNGETKSCGCLRNGSHLITHGLKKHPLYSKWRNIRKRCRDKNDKHYGAKGISWDKEWNKDFKKFYDWCLENGWEDGMYVGRIDKNKGFNKQNLVVLEKEKFFNIENAYINRSEARVFKKKDYEERHPLFCKVEEIMDDPNNLGILTKCKKCDKWFKPSDAQIQNRIRAIERPEVLSIGTENNLYCNDECSNSCPLYHLRSDPFAIKEIQEQNFTDYELKIWSDETKKRQLDEYGYNFCEIENCENPGPYFAHHEIPKKREWIFGLDPDNGIVVCKEHHDKLHKGECSYSTLRKLKCEKKDK